MELRNIGPGGRRSRFLVGAAVLGLGVAAAAALAWFQAPRGLRAALFVPFWVAALQLYQAHEHT